jgi:cubilin
MDCMKIPHSEICGHGTCVQTPSKLGYTCICEQGWRVSNTSFDCTIDIDECTEMRPHCYEGVQCYNIPGSFVCGPCPVGYSGNGYTCSDINECETNNGGCSLLPKVECINTKVSNIFGNSLTLSILIFSKLNLLYYFYLLSRVHSNVQIAQ